MRGVDGAGAEVVTYEWGDGDRTVVLIHGWNGRASQFATLARELVAEGYRVVAFDAPAHGASSGRHTYIHDWTARLSVEHAALPPGTAVLVIHDEDDRMMPFGEAERIVAAHPAARMLRTRGLGHNRILRDDILLDAVIGFGASLPRRMPVP
ncbi:alpha/beta hydrolase [Microbacterium sp. MC2]